MGTCSRSTVCVKFVPRLQFRDMTTANALQESVASLGLFFLSHSRYDTHQATTAATTPIPPREKYMALAPRVDCESGRSQTANHRQKKTSTRIGRFLSGSGRMAGIWSFLSGGGRAPPLGGGRMRPPDDPTAYVRRNRRPPGRCTRARNIGQSSRPCSGGGIMGVFRSRCACGPHLVIMSIVVFVVVRSQSSARWATR
jgi:hypothetical protein